RIEACGIDKVFVMRFDKTFASLPPIDFIHRYIIRMNARHIVVGFDFTFGKMTKGYTVLLKEEAMRQNFMLSIIPQLSYQKNKIGSTETKENIKRGDVEEVPSYLGIHYEIKGEIIEHLPCVNEYIVQFHDYHILPMEGTYVVSVNAGV